MIEIELNGQTYRLNKLNAMTQFHVSRKLASVLPSVLPLLSSVRNGSLAAAMNGDADALAKAAEPFGKALAEMSDDNANYVLNTCLSVVLRKQGDNWRPVQSPDGVLMFDDVDLGTLLPLVFRVLKESLGGFISGFATGATKANPG